MILQHTEAAPRNAIYLYAEIQNQLIQAMSDKVLMKIVEEVKNLNSSHWWLTKQQISHDKNWYHLC